MKTLAINQADADLKWSCGEKIRREFRALQQSEQEIPLLLSRIFRRHHQLLEDATMRCAIADPALALRRGYSVTKHQGKAIRSAAAVRPGDEITTLLADGQIDSVVA
jgi:exodeoxyribonuclease VII large subunit